MPFQLMTTPVQTTDRWLNHRTEFREQLEWASDRPRPTGNTFYYEAGTQVNIRVALQRHGTQEWYLVTPATMDGQHEPPIRYCFLRSDYVTMTNPGETMPDWPTPRYGRTVSLEMTNSWQGLTEVRSGMLRDHLSSSRWNVSIRRLHVQRWGGSNAREYGMRWIMTLSELMPREVDRFSLWWPAKLPVRTAELRTWNHLGAVSNEPIDRTFRHLIKGLGMEGIIFWLKISPKVEPEQQDAE